MYSAPASSAVGSIATASTSVWSSASTQRMEGANGIHHGRSEGRGCAWHPVQAARPPMDDMVGVERPPRVLPADHGGGGVIIEPVKLPPHGIEHLRQVAAGLAGYSPKGWMQTDGIRLYMIDPHSKRKMRQLYGGLVEKCSSWRSSMGTIPGLLPMPAKPSRTCCPRDDWK